MAGLAYIGPVRIDFHGTPSFKWTSNVDAFGIRDATISGEFDEDAAAQLSELAASADGAPTTGGRKGVIVRVWASGRHLEEFVGWYIFESFELDPDYEASLTGEVEGTASLGYIGDTSEIVIARSAYPKGDDFGLVAKSVVVSPFTPDDDAGDRFVVDPGGTFITREFDPTSVTDPGVPTPPGGTARLGLYIGTVTEDVDELADVARPRVSSSGAALPAALVDQGGEVRAYDRRWARDVFGPHPFLEATDLLLTNGLIRFWPGPVGAPPFLHVKAVAGSSWRSINPLGLSLAGNALRRVRLQSVTPEAATVALTVDNEGDVLVSLRRGRRAIEIVHGAGLGSPVADRLVEWLPGPPGNAAALQTGPGKFGLGLLASATEPIFVTYDWPGTRDVWTFAGWWLPAADSATQALSGLFSGWEGNTQEMAAWWDPADRRLRFKIGPTTVQSSPLTFAGGDAIFIALRLSPTEGMTLTVKTPTAALEHITDAGQTTPGGTYDELRIGWWDGSTWGSGTWGSGVWGGWRLPNGVVDNLMKFVDRVSDDELAGLAVATFGTENLPEPWSRLQWYAPYDSLGEFDPSPLTSGRVENGSPDTNGLTLGVVALDDAVVAHGLGLVVAAAASAEFEAVIATDGMGDTVTDYQAQFAAESYQELRAR